MKGKLFNGIGLGTFPFAGPFGHMSIHDSRDVLHTFLTGCGKYIDVAPTYAFGEIERFLGGELKRYHRDDFFINTSCGYVLKDGKFVVSGKYEDVLKDCDESLTRLELDYIDLYISHIPDPNTPFAETISAMKTLKQQGKIKRIGVSNVTLEQLKEYNKDHTIEFVQNRFSLLNQSISPEFASYLIDNEIKLVAYQVIDRGLLTNKMLSPFSISEGDLRSKKPEFQNHIIIEISDWVSNHLFPIAERNQISVATLAIKWALSQPHVSLCQCGATKAKYLKDFSDATSKVLTDDTIIEIDATYDIFNAYIYDKYSLTIREFLGLESYNLYSGSASGK